MIGARFLITGGGGLLARDLRRELVARGWVGVAPGRAELDVTNAPGVREFVRASAPEVVFQCAAYTSVDAAESDEEGAFRINAEGADNVAAACRKAGALLVYPSTDYVFSGRAERPWRPSDPIDPVNAYGRSKAAGEAAARAAPHHLVVRTSWLYGRGGKNFVDTIAALLRERPELHVVADQIGRPTWSGSLARTLVELVEAGAEGTFHATDGGPEVSWHGLACAVAERIHATATVHPVSTSSFPRPAPRPAYSVLDCSDTERRIGHALPDWREVLSAYLASTR